MSDTSTDPITSRRVRRGRPRLLLVLAGLFAVVGGLAFGIGWALDLVHPTDIRLRFSEPYRLACALAEHDPQVQAHLGAIDGYGWLPRGDLQVAGREGWCELEMTVRGRDASARLESRLVRRGGTWFWEWANLRLDDGTLITLAAP